MSNQYKNLNKPKVSIVICNYNYAAYIACAISSALNQTYQPSEIIIIDDGSTDHSVEIIKSFSDKVKIVQKDNGGQVSAYNEGIKHVSGDVVIFLDADDALLPNALEEIADKFYENVVKVHYLMRIIDKDGNDLNSILPRVLDFGDCSKALIKHGVMYKSPPASGNAYRVDAIKKIFPLPISADEKHGADYFCIYGISFLGNIEKVNKPLFKYRIHQASDSIFNSLGFGNAVKKQDRLQVMLTRWKLFCEWVFSNSEGKIVLPDIFLDFTVQKYLFASDVVYSNSINARFLASKRHLFWILRAIYFRHDFSLTKKIGLLGWVFLVLILPKNMSLKVARLVCNPIKKTQCAN